MRRGEEGVSESYVFETELVSNTKCISIRYTCAGLLFIVYSVDFPPGSHIPFTTYELV